MTHFSDDDIPPECLALDERSTSHHSVTIVLGDAPMGQVCEDSSVRRLHARLPDAYS
jgi:hypothetical protein